MDVYAELGKYGVVVTGGRDGGVGVGGFLLGGGLTYYMGCRGFGCDSVVNYEVVLSDGSVINANQNENSDLWRALKGGGANFGIVTRFDMDALPADNLTYALRTISTNYSNEVTNAVTDFMNQAESFPNDALIVFYSHDASSKSPNSSITAIEVNTLGDTNTSGFDRVNKIPTLTKESAEVSLADAAAGSWIYGGDWIIGFTATFKNDPTILRHCVQLHEKYVEDMTKAIGAQGFITYWFLQPVPKFYSDVSVERGGNMLGLDAVQGNAVMWTGSIKIATDDAALAVARLHLSTVATEIQEFAKSKGGDVDLIYLNYADLTQDPLGSYGANNTQLIREMAAKYDPSGMFQERIPGGFKISRVD